MKQEDYHLNLTLKYMSSNFGYILLVLSDTSFAKKCFFISNQLANNGKSSLDLIKNEKHRQAVAKLRSSNHKLRIETDRYYLFLRILECASFACRINKVENKIHFLLE